MDTDQSAIVTVHVLIKTKKSSKLKVIDLFFPSSAQLEKVVSTAIEEVKIDDRCMKSWLVISSGVVHSDLSISLQTMGSLQEIYVVLLPMFEEILISSDEQYITDMISNVTDVQYSEDAKDTQDNGTALKLLPTLSNLVSTASSDKEYYWDSFPTDFQKVFSYMQKRGVPSSTSPVIHWFDEYGCALVCQYIQPNSISVSLVCLDGWTFHIHNGPTSNMHSSTPSAYEPSVLFVGVVEKSRFEAFMKGGYRILKGAQEHRGAERSAAQNHHGHQKTPTMIQSVFLRAIQTGQGEAAYVKPRGGFTDVGKHTGGLPKNTSWSLLLSVCSFFLDKKGTISYFQKAVALSLLHLAECLAFHMFQGARTGTGEKCISSINNFNVQINIIMQTLTNAADEIEGFILMPGSTEAVQLCESRFVRARYWMEQARKMNSDSIAGLYHLQPILESDLSFGHFHINIPPDHELMFSSNPQAISDLINTNIGFLPSPPEENICPQELEKWMDAAEHFNMPGNAFFQLLICEAVEKAFFSYISPEISPALEADGTVIFSLVNRYRGYVEKVLENPDLKMLTRTDIISRELLVVWISAILLYTSTAGEFYPLWSYALPLCQKNLQYLVLTDKKSIQAAEDVYSFLFSHRYGKKVVFSLSESDRTFELSRLVSESCPRLKQIVENEICSAEKRKRKHWEEVQEKKRKLTRLDKELVKLEEEKISIEENLKEWTSAYNEAARWSKAEGHAQHKKEMYESKRSEKESEIIHKKMEIRNTERPPPPILQPLPKDRNMAHSIAFMLFMPEPFRNLSSMIITAQSLLLPKENVVNFHHPCHDDRQFFVERYVTCTPDETGSWTDYYLKQASGRKIAISPPNIHLGVKEKVRKEFEITVRNMSSDEQDVWYPDSLGLVLYWSGGPTNRDCFPGTKYFNPFHPVPEFVYISQFTEKMKEHRSLQWATYLSSGNELSSRENEPEASQSSAPSSFQRKCFYVSYGKIRSDRFCQIRRIIGTISQKSVDFRQRDVRTLLHQSLYQLGEISFSNGTAVLEWRRDLFPWNGMKTMKMEILLLLEEMRFKIRDHAIIPVLSDLCGYIEQIEEEEEEDNRALILGEISERWADNLNVEQNAATPSKEDSIRARRRLFYLYSILSVPRGKMNESYAGRIIRCLILSEYNRIFTVTADVEIAVKPVLTMVRAIVAHHSQMLKSVLLCSPHIITRAIQSVLQDTPDDLEWYPEEKSIGTLCFSAEKNGRKYTVNIATGVVLIDGMPPQRLPLSITLLPMYKRSFGDENFEVVRKFDGEFQTTSLVSGRYYAFFQTSANSVRIRESECSTFEECYELLDGTECGTATWGKDLPLRLKNMYSHWMCSSLQLIAFRPIPFRQRKCLFYMVSSSGKENESNNEQWYRGDGVQCFRVPSALHNVQLHHSKERILKLERLVKMVGSGSEQIYRMLQRIEPIADYIESYTTTERKILFCLPRFSLEFEIIDEVLCCKTLNEFQVSSNQQLEGALYGFNQYLVLAKGSIQKMLMPSGYVSASDRQINVSPKCDEHLSFHVFNVHRRFGKLEAEAGEKSIEARLQLAALYAACGTLLPEERNKHTGAETALQILRGCWINRPFRETEKLHLSSIGCDCPLIPSLSLLKYEVEKSSEDLSFLYGKQKESTTFDESEASDYYRRKHRYLSRRTWLRVHEERQIFGFGIDEQKRLRNDRCKEIRVVEHDISNFTEPIITSLESMVAFKAAEVQEGSRDEKRVKWNRNNTAISREIGDDLRKSWQTFHNLPKPSCRDADSINMCKEIIGRDNVQGGNMSRIVDSMRDAMTGHFGAILSNCQKWRSFVEQACLHALEFIPQKSADSSLFKIRRVINHNPSPTTYDILSCALDDTIINQFNPFINKASTAAMTRMAQGWMDLCILEDKLIRLVQFSRSSNTEEISHELSTIRRSWKAKDHLHWVAFEVEQQLQIRNLQYEIAHHLLENNRRITQLNMGEGKTRVILPIIVLELVLSRSLVRLNFLKPLFSEAFNYLHNALTGGLFCIRLYCFPFERRTVLTPDRVESIRNILERSIDCRAVVCVTPEHRLSLQLKSQEIALAKVKDWEVMHANLTAIARLPFHDLLDESDELLSHKYQLIYAMGECVQLPNASTRWTIVESVLEILQSNPIIRSMILSFSKCTDRNRSVAGSFDRIQLISGADFEKSRHELFSEIVRAVLDKPPYGFKWIGDSSIRNVATSFVLDSSIPLSETRKHLMSHGWPDERIEETESALLILRGLLSSGILERCLVKRYRVDYGIDSNRLNTRVAVPFRASDVPSERAEYAQPDTLIVYTLLAYYHRGLSKGEVREAIDVLLSMGPNAQQDVYSKWFKRAQRTLTEEQSRMMDVADKLDPSSDVQMKMLHTIYRFNMETINFWLNSCVFPRETMQFPKRMCANAFDLAESEQNVIGFSGTKDLRLLLPIQVRHSVPPSDIIQSTDGKMAAVILKNNVVFRIPPGDVWIETIDLALSEGVEALIDAGATMSGKSNETVAEKVVQRLQIRNGSSYKGVVFYDVEVQTWIAMSCDKRKWPLGSSPISTRDAFVYFDESHCRGSDMKLKETACALLTIGPNMTKDKLMQAVGRMRKIDRGQTIKFAVPCELVKAISGSVDNVPTSANILNWVLENAMEKVAGGMYDWALQGLAYYSKICSGIHSYDDLEDEILGLEELYGGSRSAQTVSSIATRRRSQIEKTSGESTLQQKDRTRDFLQSLFAHIDMYGSDYAMVRNGEDEECEREIEYEKEIEEQEERELVSVLPRAHEKWEYEASLHCKSIAELPARARVTTLEAALQSYMKNSPVLAVKWGSCNIFVTQNFMNSVMSPDELCDVKIFNVGEYLRPVDGILFFRSGQQILLLSEVESGHILKAMWSNSSQAHSVTFLNFFELRKVQNVSLALTTCLMRIPTRMDDEMNELEGDALDALERSLCGLKLFAGVCSFSTDESRRSLKSLLPNANAKKGAMEIICLRGERTMMPNSDLEKVCLDES